MVGMRITTQRPAKNTVRVMNAVGRKVPGMIKNALGITLAVMRTTKRIKLCRELTKKHYKKKPMRSAKNGRNKLD